MPKKTTEQFIKESSEQTDSLNIRKVMKVLNVFETGKPERDYSSVFTWNDGPNGRKQLTLGVGFTQGGSLQKVIEKYISYGGKNASYFSKFNFNDLSLAYNKDLIARIKSSGEEPEMIRAQDEVYREKYWIPAKKFFDDNGFTEPLSMLVIADSTLHSGSIPSWLRKRFKEKPPAAGGDERNWITEYVKVRHDWLWSKGGLLRNTVYRTNCFKEQIKKEMDYRM